MKKRLALALALGIVAPRVRGEESLAAAFEKLKSLEGTWESVGSDGKKKTTTYEVVANGSALFERYEDESMPPGSEMLTMYHLDSGRLVLTHYCMSGNQPRMRATSFDEATGELKFDFLDATNLKSATDGHMHRARFRFEGPDRLTTEWEYFENGKTAFSEVVPISRVKR